MNKNIYVQWWDSTSRKKILIVPIRLYLFQFSNKKSRNTNVYTLNWLTWRLWKHLCLRKLIFISLIIDGRQVIYWSWSGAIPIRCGGHVRILPRFGHFSYRVVRIRKTSRNGNCSNRVWWQVWIFSGVKLFPLGGWQINTHFCAKMYP